MAAEQSSKAITASLSTGSACFQRREKGVEVEGEEKLSCLDGLRILDRGTYLTTLSCSMGGPRLAPSSTDVHFHDRLVEVGL
jgi:hypothetical protein